jgi:hypothetical protein
LALSMEQAREKLRALETELRLRTPDIEKYSDYYKGKHKLRYASDEFRTWFEEKFTGFADNWCAPVVDATVERLKPQGIRPYGEQKVDSDLQRVWEENSCPSGSKLAFTTSAISSRAFAMVWGSEDGPEITFEHPAQCIVGYKPGSRRKREAAAKIWRQDSFVYGNLYTEDGIYKFQRLTTSETKGPEAEERKLYLPIGFTDWEPREVPGEPWPVPNPMGMVPMVEIQNRPQLAGDPLNEISGVSAMQDAINSLWSYLFTSADFAALPQRVILGAQLPKMPILDSEGRKIGEKPIDLPEANVKRILNLEGPDAKIDSWEAAALDIFTGVIEKSVGHIAAQTRTPIYYFASSIQNISGDTLQALDAGLVAKIEDRIMFMDDPVKDIYELIALALGEVAKAKAIKAGTVQWADYENRSDAQKMDRLTKMQSLGFPDEYIFEQYTGGDADEVQRILDMRKREAENDPLSAAYQRRKGMEDQAANQSREEAAATGRVSGTAAAKPKAKMTGGSDNGGTDGSGRKPK